MNRHVVTNIVTQIDPMNNRILGGIEVGSTIIETINNQLVVIDTGMVSSTALVKEMAEWGYDSSMVNLVINTHLHPDHAGGNRLFPNARILLSRREMEYENQFIAQLRGENQGSVSESCIRCLPKVLLLAWQQQAESDTFYAMLGDFAQIEYLEDRPFLPPGFSIIEAPGHTIAHSAVLIKGINNNLLVCGDAYYHRDLGTQITYPGLNYDDQLFLANALQLSRFRGILAPGHDKPFWSLSREYLLDDQFEL